MTREEKAREAYAQAVERLGGPARMSIAADIRADTSSKYYHVTMAAMLAFADAEAAAMRERAADRDGTTEETQAGAVICHCSEDDGVPDVGVSVGLGDGKALWIGELLTRDGATCGFVFYGPDGQRLVAPFADGTDWQEIADLFRHRVGPAIGKIAETAREAMKERAGKACDGYAPAADSINFPDIASGECWAAQSLAKTIRALPATGEVGR